MNKFAWTDAGKYVNHAAPAAMFLQYATDEPFLSSDTAKRYFEIVSEPKKLKIYEAPHALNAEATQDRIAFLAEQLSFKRPETGRHSGDTGFSSAPVAKGPAIDSVKEPT